jgi:hypothetical protein
MIMHGNTVQWLHCEILSDKTGFDEDGNSLTIFACAEGERPRQMTDNAKGEKKEREQWSFCLRAMIRIVI